MAGSICTSAKAYISELGKLLERVDCATIDSFAEMLFDAWREGRHVFFFGNGGSATTAGHHAMDLTKTAAVPGQPRLKAMSLNDNYGITTAVGNDISYEESLSYPLESYAQAGDIAVGITCSGNSPNVLRACRWAREHGLKVVAITGFAGGKVKDLADLHINFPSDNYGLVEDLQLAVGHMVAQALKAKVEAQAKETLACKC
jgi:D-sedoheptulose 7-phosphate isomerase